ncbi:MAG: PSD1 domain-containing protein [Candidatus Hydrogenedentes bacterium]|nr:PSD1 domain-containing protein [Candidatus Hydrogenedentota bacterium]
MLSRMLVLPVLLCFPGVLHAQDLPLFNRDVRPILSEHCFACHGPDTRSRKAGLRLDLEANAFAALESGNKALVAGDLDHSALVQRILTDDPDDRMPPPEFAKPLSEQQIDILKRWVAAGAQWQQHWSFIPPVRPAVPAVTDAVRVRNPIDNFIVAALETHGKAPSEEADKVALIRRVSFDLTGLPPSMEEADAFLADDRPDAYEQLVDRLLASPRYGEHMARYWLDAARYADTHGFHIDNERFMWPWRDWVIQSYNENKPFDQFSIEQIAGDLLPNPTLNQKVGSGFNRNHMINFEGGAIPEEYRTQYVNDRVATTGTVWFGLTVNCAQCHDHKYDPILQKDYYSFSAFFNSIKEEGLDGRDGNANPLIKAPRPEQEARLAEIATNIARIDAEMKAPMPEVDAAQAAWETEAATAAKALWQVLEPAEYSAAEGATLTPLPDASLLAGEANPADQTYSVAATTTQTGITAVRLEAIPHGTLPFQRTGRAPNGNFVLSEFTLEVAPAGASSAPQAIRFVAADADHGQPEFPVANAIDGNPATGYGGDGEFAPGTRTLVFIPERPFGFPAGSKLSFKIAHSSEFKQHAIGRFRLAVSTGPAWTLSSLGPWYVNGPFTAESGQVAYATAYPPESAINLDETYEDGRLKWSRITSGFEDGQIHELFGNVAATYLYRTITSPGARTARLSVGSNDAVKIWVNGQVVHDNNVQRGAEKDQDSVSIALNEGKNGLLVKVVNYGNRYDFYFRKAQEQSGSMPLAIEAILSGTATERTPAQQEALQAYYRERHAPQWQELQGQRKQLLAEQAQVDAEVPTTMVMGELEQPRDTFVLLRGEYDQFGEKVVPAVPAVFPPIPEELPKNRLGLAQWLMSSTNPLPARVNVNRLWQQVFGTGIVKTSEDFGSQGAWPSHPELLDWLAVEFIESGWDVKHMMRLMVTSSTYRQTSRIRPDLQEWDPANVYLARAPRYRLDAEMVRDNALFVAGLLKEQVGGRSVYPYQPAGLWEEVAYGGGGASFSAQVYKVGQGDDLYRRSMYTFWKRTAPPPTMMLFDAPNRETCTVKRGRTNTPLQALVLMNDPQYVEAARILAMRTLQAQAGAEADRIAYAFRLATSRAPKAEELAILQNVLEAQRQVYREHPEEAEKLLGVGEAPLAGDMDKSELAAWSTIASMILNLDETITKS